MEEAALMEAKKKAQESRDRDVFKGGRQLQFRSEKEPLKQKKKQKKEDPEKIAMLKFLGDLEENELNTENKN